MKDFVGVNFWSVFRLVPQPSTWLPVFAAERRAAAPVLLGARARRCRSISPARMALSSCWAAAVGRWDRLRDGWMLERFIDPAVHTVSAMSIMNRFIIKFGDMPCKYIASNAVLVEVYFVTHWLKWRRLLRLLLLLFNGCFKDKTGLPSSVSSENASRRRRRNFASEQVKKKRVKYIGFMLSVMRGREKKSSPKRSVNGRLLLIGTVCLVCGAGSMKRYGVRQSVPAWAHSSNPGRAGDMYRSVAAAATWGGWVRAVPCYQRR